MEGRVPAHLIPQFYVLLKALQVGFKLHNLGSEVLVEAARRVRIVDEWDEADARELAIKEAGGWAM